MMNTPKRRFSSHHRPAKGTADEINCTSRDQPVFRAPRVPARARRSNGMHPT